MLALQTDSLNLPEQLQHALLLPSPLVDTASAQHFKTHEHLPLQGCARRGKKAGGRAEVIPTAGNFALQVGALPICNSNGYGGGWAREHGVPQVGLLRRRFATAAAPSPRAPSCWKSSDGAASSSLSCRSRAPAGKKGS